MKKYFILPLLSVLTLTGSLVLSGVSSVATGASTTTPSTLERARLSVDVVTAAGFTGVKAKTPLANRFLPPVYYFETTETIAQTNRAAWGEASNLIAVLVQPIKNEKWVFNKGDMQVTELEGRFQAALSSPGYFIVVTGPDRSKVMTLAHNLKVLY